MPSTDETVNRILDTPTWDRRVAEIRQIPAQHGLNEQTRLYAEVARQLYVPHLAPDFAYAPVEVFSSFLTFNAPTRRRLKRPSASQGPQSLTWQPRSKRTLLCSRHCGL